MSGWSILGKQKHHRNMIILFKALATGMVVGAVFALMDLPIPAPPTIIGIAGIFGIFLGYILFI
jgi:XapX domain-containing protein